MRLDNLSFSYPLFGITGRSLKVAVMKQLVGGQVASHDDVVVVNALRGISFELNPGDRLALDRLERFGKDDAAKVACGVGPALKWPAQN